MSYPQALVEALRRHSEDQIVAALFSLSSSTPGLLGRRLPEFEKDLRAALRAASPQGCRAECRRDSALDFWWPGTDARGAA